MRLTMQSNPGAVLQINGEDIGKQAGLSALEQIWTAKLKHLVILVFALNFFSAALFIVLVNRLVYDEPYNIFDVHNYASLGLSEATFLSHRNPPGPTGFLWMAAGVRILGGEELRAARIATLMSWVFLGIGILIGARYSHYPQLWYGALLAALVFPHAVESMATLLTEGPSLFFAVLGGLGWAETASRPNTTRRLRFVLVFAGLCMGLAISCRQYYLALLPAAAFFAVNRWGELGLKERPRWTLALILSLAFAAIPVLLMIFVWKGISSPGMATGSSYDHMWKATVGLNLSRPIVVGFYTGVYIVPLTFPAMFRLKRSAREWALAIAVLGAIGIVHWSSVFLQPGPLHSLVRFASRLPGGGTAVLAAVACVVIYNMESVCWLLWERRQNIALRDLVVFALLVVLFFIAEQIGVGGNLPFYDRYTLQVAPFVGVIAFALLPRLTVARLSALASLLLLSHIMLWRYAFATRP